MPEVADPTLAIIAYLQLKMGAAANHYCRPELPQPLNPEMPTSVVVAMPGGGGSMMGANRLPIYDSIVDVLTYGTTRLEGDELARQAQYYLRQFNQVISEGVLMYWCRETSGIMPRLEPNVAWPYSEFSVQCLHSELAGV